MKKGHLYTLAFMVILTVVFILALALAYEGFKPSIQKHARLREERALLYAFGLDQGLSDAQIHDKFTQSIKESQLNGKPAYAWEENGQVKGYAVPFEGPGLWGSISGYLGVNAQLNQATGLVFTKQSETPGLGGRIDEDWYKEQFRSVPLAKDSALAYGQHDGYKIDAITGATQTSSAVLRILNQLLHTGIFTGEVK